MPGLSCAFARLGNWQREASRRFWECRYREAKQPPWEGKQASKTSPSQREDVSQRFRPCGNPSVIGAIKQIGEGQTLDSLQTWTTAAFKQINSRGEIRLPVNKQCFQRSVAMQTEPRTASQTLPGKQSSRLITAWQQFVVGVCLYLWYCAWRNWNSSLIRSQESEVVNFSCCEEACRKQSKTISLKKERLGWNTNG